MARELWFEHFFYGLFIEQSWLDGRKLCLPAL